MDPKDYRYDFGDFQRHNVTVACDDESAKRDGLLWFRYGMVHMFSFHHEEAIKCFERATTCVPRFPLAWYFIAYCQGPNYNFHNDNGYYEECLQADGFPSMQKGFTAIQQANTLSAEMELLPVETDLIQALNTRIVWPLPEDVTVLNVEFAKVMRGLLQKYGSTDSDVAFIGADALMALRPWKLWESDESRVLAQEVQNILENALKRDPRHPGLCHLYIHCMEMSDDPGISTPVADRLLTLVKDCGHLTHMPSHIYVLTGEYEKAILSNELAIVADEKCISAGIGGQPGSFSLQYICHDYHMLVYAAMMAGIEPKATKAAESLVAKLPADVLKLDDTLRSFLEPFCGIPFHTMIRFGQWQKIIDHPFHEDRNLYATATATQFYARAIAYAVLENIPAAEEAEKEFHEIESGKDIEGRVLFNNTVKNLLAVNHAMLRGEIEYRKGNYDVAFKELRKGVELDDSLEYDEPWGQMQPVRHALGALLLEQGKTTEAAKVYREDLALGKHPRNVWSLQGLCLCLKQINTPESLQEMATYESLLKAGRSAATIQVTASCACAKKMWKSE